jgi:hypothetical protein
MKAVTSKLNWLQCRQRSSFGGKKLARLSKKWREIAVDA